GATEETSDTGAAASYPPTSGRHVAAGGKVPAFDEPATAPAAYGETIYGEPGRPGYSGTESGGVPLRDYDDPFDGQSGRL
ncbi:hypothetical protein, partial [Pseudarthrobacter sp. NamE2]|uniref:hypothetical protein n=1 Tax=Pseudarthrobacter sp. NamE2 TaxID=2576838 RepID=UPI00197ADE7E